MKSSSVNTEQAAILWLPGGLGVVGEPRTRKS